MFKIKKFILILFTSLLFVLLQSNTITEKDEVNNCRSVVERDDMKLIVSVHFFNENKEEIYDPTYPNIIKTPDKLDENGKKTGLWTVFLDRSFLPKSSVITAMYYRIATYENGLPVGVVKDYFKDGSLQFEGKLLSEFPSVYDGTIKIYFSDGSIKSTRSYTNGILEGLYKLFINDKRVTSGSYRNKFEDGVYTKYIQPLDSLVEKFYILNGEQDSLHYIYDTYGRNIKSITRFKENKKNGVEQIFDKNGVLSKEGNWIKGKKMVYGSILKMVSYQKTSGI
ncbi:toxin-antitoxin system YwqK family antitoxin [Candidatus Cloacimonadota bacterium]